MGIGTFRLFQFYNTGGIGSKSNSRKFIIITNFCSLVYLDFYYSKLGVFLFGYTNSYGSINERVIITAREKCKCTIYIR